MNDKWEYKTLWIGPERILGRTRIEHIEANLNALGQEGWEAFSHAIYQFDKSDVYCFKRKIS